MTNDLLPELSVADEAFGVHSAATAGAAVEMDANFQTTSELA